MILAHTQHDICELAPMELSAIWGPAAGAQIQTSPGASALAAPLQNFSEPATQRARAKTKWIGVMEAVISVGGLAGMIGGLYLLASSPLPGVMSILASMTLLLGMAGKVAQKQEARCASSRQKSARH